MFGHQFIEDCGFRHEGHKHGPLTLLMKPAFFHCDACNTEAKDLSNVCTNFMFWIHQSCASLPATMECELHDHPLILAFSLPKQFITFPQFCNIRTKRVHPSRWLYYCANCRYFAHLKCDNQILCDGCVQPILTDPFYCCVHCDFYLHRFCAMLPLKMQHPSHPEHEFIRDKSTKPNFLHQLQ